MLAALLAALPTQAQEPRALTVNAQLLFAVPADGAIAIEPRDDSDENLRLRDLMIARLRERHGAVAADTVAADAPLLLRFSTAVVSDRDTTRATGPTGGGRRGGRGLGAALGGAGNPPAGGALAHPSTGVRTRVTAALERRDGGQMLWKAEVTATPGDANPRLLPAQLAAAVIDNIGRTVDTRVAAGAAAAPR